MKDVKNLDKAFKLLDTENTGEITYDLKRSEGELSDEMLMQYNSNDTKIKYNDFMNAMLDRISKSKTSKKGILFESGKFKFILIRNFSCNLFYLSCK